MSAISPGNYTVRWMLDVRRAPSVQPLRLAQVASYAVQPRFGMLQGAAVQPTDAEIVRHPASDDALTGVIRLRVANTTDTETLGEAIKAAVRTIPGCENAVAHLSASAAAPAAAAPALFPLYAVVGLATRFIPSVRERVSTSLGNVVVQVTPGIDNTARPIPSTNVVGAALSGSSTRESADPARSGSLAGQAARDVTNAVAEASTLSPGAIVAIVAVSSALVVLGGVLIVRRFT